MKIYDKYMTNESDKKPDLSISGKARSQWLWHLPTDAGYDTEWRCKKIQPLLSSSTQCPTIYPLSLSIVMTIPFSHLAPAQPVKQWQRKSPFLSSQRTVPLALQGEGEHWSGISLSVRKQRQTDAEKRRVITALKFSLYKQDAYNACNCILVPDRGRASLLFCVSGVQYK